MELSLGRNYAPSITHLCINTFIIYNKKKILFTRQSKTLKRKNNTKVKLQPKVLASITYINCINDCGTGSSNAKHLIPHSLKPWPNLENNLTVP